jgi:hypothetical protein
MAIDPAGARAAVVRSVTTEGAPVPGERKVPERAAVPPSRPRPDAFEGVAPPPDEWLAENRFAPLPVEHAIAESICVRKPSARLPTAQQIWQIEAGGKTVLFGTVALREALQLGDKQDEFAAREQVQGVVVTVDSYESLDLDNALSLRFEADGTAVVGVHAVDAAEWIRVGGAVDHGARRRHETRYLEDHGLVLPMLPRSLSEGKLSLFQDQPRLTLSVELCFTPGGEWLAGRMFKSTLVNRHRLDAQDAEQARLGLGRGAAHPELQRWTRCRPSPPPPPETPPRPRASRRRRCWPSSPGAPPGSWGRASRRQGSRPPSATRLTAGRAPCTGRRRATPPWRPKPTRSGQDPCAATPTSMSSAP